MDQMDEVDLMDKMDKEFSVLLDCPEICTISGARPS